MTPEDRSEECELVLDAASYLLGALDDPRSYERHLEHCAACRAEIAELRPVVVRLATTAPQARAPKDMRRQLLERVSGEAQVLRAAGPGADRPSRRPRLGPRRLLVLASIWTIAIAVGVAAIVGAPGGARSERLRYHTRLAATLSGARASLRELDGHAELLVNGMPQAPLGKTYEVWLQRGAKQPQPTDALFSVSNRGRGSVNIPDPLTHVREVMVTAEPLGGSTRPTGPPLIRFYLRHST
ncbi:MAG: anti-sigma factor [Solirubrobacteraceae bacterium]